MLQRQNNYNRTQISPSKYPKNARGAGNAVPPTEIAPFISLYRLINVVNRRETQIVPQRWSADSLSVMTVSDTSIPPE